MPKGRKYSGVGKFEDWLDRKTKSVDREFDRVMDEDGENCKCDSHAGHQEYARAEQATAMEIWNKFQELTKKK